jgi:hypothetical protein
MLCLLCHAAAFAGRRSNLGRQPESAQLPVEDASSIEHARSINDPATTAWPGSSQQQQQQPCEAGYSVATQAGSGLRHRLSWGAAAAAAALTGRGSSFGGPASRRASHSSAAASGIAGARTAGVANQQSYGKLPGSARCCRAGTSAPTVAACTLIACCCSHTHLCLCISAKCALLAL